MNLQAVLPLWMLSAQADARSTRWAPRLRRWLKKLKQYGRLQIEVDLRGVLQL